MRRIPWARAALLSLTGLLFASCAGATRQSGTPPVTAAKVYGEWLISVTPDRRSEYDQLIREQGLPLFREAGGRMVGWWNTLIGDLYEHVTIWEYDNMAAFQRAVEFLGSDERFARFVASRDPLLEGETNRFLTLAAGGKPPQLPESAAYVVHEIHRVPLGLMPAYLDFMTTRGLPLLKKQGLRLAGPWVTAVGPWGGEVLYLFKFDSLSERDELVANFTAHPDSSVYEGALGEFVDRMGCSGSAASRPHRRADVRAGQLLRTERRESPGGPLAQSV